MRHPDPDLPLVRALTPALRTRRFGRVVRAYRVTASTNTDAAAWAAEGAPEGALVVAEEQTAGRGRFDRRWVARPGQNLTFSLVLRPALEPARLGLLTVAAAVGMAEALDPVTAPLRPRIKWPNDLLLEGGKCGGMLLEAALTTGRPTPDAVILGIGLNVNQDRFPEGLGTRPTSLLLETGRPVERAALLATLLAHIEAAYDLLTGGGSAALRARYEARLDGVGAPAHLHLPRPGDAVTGTLAGIDETGALILETAAGPRIFHAGDVTTKPTA